MCSQNFSGNQFSILQINIKLSEISKLLRAVIKHLNIIALNRRNSTPHKIKIEKEFIFNIASCLISKHKFDNKTFDQPLITFDR